MKSLEIWMTAHGRKLSSARHIQLEVLPNSGSQIDAPQAARA